MPRGDRTGPFGTGPMTGRGAGYCAGYSVPGYMNPIPTRGWGFGYGAGWGRGRGWGRGFGRGFGWRWAVSPYGYPAVPYTPGVRPQQETELLKEQAKAVQEELNAINQRIKELESNNTSENDG